MPSPAGRRWMRAALPRKSWLFCGADRGGDRAAMMYSLIVTAKMNDVDPQAWLADLLARIAAYQVQRLDELLPWNWRPKQASQSGGLSDRYAVLTGCFAGSAGGAEHWAIIASLVEACKLNDVDPLAP